MNFHRFHVMRCDNDEDRTTCVRYPCPGSPPQARARCVKYPCAGNPPQAKARCVRYPCAGTPPQARPRCVKYPCAGSPTQAKKKPKPFCSRCGRSEPCDRIHRYFQPCNSCKQVPACINRHVCTCKKKKKKKLKNKNINTDCTLVSRIPKCKRRRKKKISLKSSEVLSPCSILSLQNKHGLVNPHPSQHRYCRKFYPLPQICCYRNTKRDDCDGPKYYYRTTSCGPCEKTIATNTSAILEPKCVQIRKKMNEMLEGSCNVAPDCNSPLVPCNNAPLKCTTVSKGCMYEPSCCKELVGNLNSATCQHPVYCNDAPCQFDGVPPCDRPIFGFNDPPCEIREVPPCDRPKPPCKTNEGFTCFKSRCCNNDPTCKVDENAPCYKQTCFDPPCKSEEIFPCRLPKCLNHIPCKRKKVPPCNSLKCVVDEYAPCQRPPKTRSRRTNTKTISRCWKLKKLPKIRKCIRNQACCSTFKTCDMRNSKNSVCDCLRNLRTRALTCCMSGKQTQVSTILDPCWNNPCQSPNIITKISCNDPERNVGLLPSCTPNCEKYLTDCGIKPCDSLLGCYLYRKQKCIKKIKARRRRQKCCKCFLTCSVALFCAPCFLIALSYWLIKYICSTCNDKYNCNAMYPCEMPSGDMCYNIPGLNENCHGKYCVDKNNKICTNSNCPILPDETLILNGCEQKCFKKVAFEQPCPNNYDLCNRPLFDGSDERCIQTSRCCTKKSHPDPQRQYNLYYVDERGWVIKPVSGGGDNNCITEPFQCNSPGPMMCPPRRLNCAKSPKTTVLVNRADKLGYRFKKAKCSCFKALPCSVANALECSYMKARCCMKDCGPGARNSCNYYCPRKKGTCRRAFGWASRAYRDLDNAHLCCDMRRRVFNDMYPLKPTITRTASEIIRSTCKLFRCIIYTCFCCPIFFCFYCCNQCCRKICCCIFC